MGNKAERCTNVGRDGRTCTRLAGHVDRDIERSGYAHHEYRTAEAEARYAALCRATSAKWRRLRVVPRLKLVADYKLARGCARCGYNENSVALDLDHLDRTTKVATVSDIASQPGKYTEEDLRNELSKCQVLCKNCHAIKSYEEKDYLPL